MSSIRSLLITLTLLAFVSSVNLGIFPIYEYPENFQTCAKYKCLDNQEHCASSKLSPEFEITLSNICKSNEFCDIGGNNDPNDVFYEQKEIIGECKPKKYKPTLKRYPGEDCESNDDCAKPAEGLGKCVEGKCTGIQKYSKCENTDSCLVGTYCDGSTHRCEVQKDEYENCKTSYECKNNLLCYQGQCKDVLFTLDIGSKVNEPSIKPDYYCKYGLAVNNICVKLLGSSMGYTECKKGTQCTYTYIPSIQGKATLPCECGYNEEGKGYCPTDHAINTEAWEKYFKIMKLKFDNECHTYSRFNCYKNEEDFIGLVKECENELKMGHRYHKSVECASKVFNGLN